MRSPLKNWPGLRLIAALAFVGWQPLGAADFRAGAAQVDITPPVGTPRGGSYATIPSVGVLAPLHAKAIVVEQDGQKAAFVVLDVAYTLRAVVVAARKLIAEQTGIPGDRVMISATHTHSGPVLTRHSLMDDVTGGKHPLVVEFTAKLPGLIARAVAEAHSKLAPAVSSSAIGREENLSFNRRFLMKDGTYSWQGPRLSPKMQGPAGPIDPDVGVWCLATAGKKSAPIATYVNFAMHPTVIGGNRFHPDFPGYLAKRLAEYFGPEMVTFFANGCCGDINQVNVNWAAPQNGPAFGERVGTMLAAAVFRALPDLAAHAPFAPRVRTRLVTLERRTFSEAEIAEARRNQPRLSDPRFSIPEKARVVCILDTVAGRDVPLEVEVQVIALSPELAIVALPGEMFVELGLSLKQRSPFKHTLIAELANGSIGYIPTRRAYPQGLYEVISARGVAGSGELLIDTALELLREVARP
jgi:hypothetical protein